MLLLLTVIISSYLIYLYVYIQSEKTIDFEQTKQKVLSETLMTEIIDIKRFHGEQYYHIVFGTDELRNDYIAFVEQSDDADIIYVNTVDVFSEEYMIHQWEIDCESCQLVRIIPAIIDDNLLWEITYIDESEKYVMDYYSIDRGELHERIKLLQIFK